MHACEGPSDVFDQPAASAGEDTQPLPPPEAQPAEHEMQTVLTRFSRRFEGDFRPLLTPLERVSRSLESAELPPRLHTVLPTLRDLHHQLQMLVDKVAQQQAYVLIFGPLKSGKSTFMNSLCSTYVSEVTSLPAYPCLVSVSNGQDNLSVVTRYDGTRTTFTDTKGLHDMVLRAHGELVRRIREIESGGQQFDPALHMPEAIRRIDAKLPTPVLAESGAVLVDTPGLYSRMKFGYDRMTRDFRHAAACAIFVVKTDNLFLEQVFHEFNELLELFSRVFLVVNLDTTKKDLSADGQLVPSLERSNPQAIIEAFRDLTMSAPLKAAADAGRLNIYPLDLLGSASRRIRQARGEPPSPAELLEEQGDGRFESLVADLTEYLNSNEYLREFLGDSLRRASGLVGEMGDLVEHEALRDLSAQLTALRDEHARAAAQVEALDRLAGQDFAHRAESLQESLLAGAVRQAQEIRDDVSTAISHTVDGWFQDDSSLKSLREGRLEELLNSARDRLVDYVHSELQRQVASPSGGLSLADNCLADLRNVALDAQAAATTVLGEDVGEPDLPQLKSSLETPQIPIRKLFWDYVLLRSRASVRQRVLGPPENPARPIPVQVKVSRLGDAARQKMKELAVNQLETVLETISRYNPEQTVQAYAHRLAARLNEQIARLRDEMTARKADLARKLGEVEHVLSDVHVLDEHVQQAEQDLNDMREEFLNPTPTAQISQAEPPVDQAGPQIAQAGPPADQAEPPPELDEVQVQDTAPAADEPDYYPQAVVPVDAEEQPEGEPPVSDNEKTRPQPANLIGDEEDQAEDDQEESLTAREDLGLVQPDEEDLPATESAGVEIEDRPAEPAAVDLQDRPAEPAGDDVPEVRPGPLPWEQEETAEQTPPEPPAVGADEDDDRPAFLLDRPGDEAGDDEPPLALEDDAIEDERLTPPADRENEPQGEYESEQGDDLPFKLSDPDEERQ